MITRIILLFLLLIIIIGLYIYSYKMSYGGYENYQNRASLEIYYPPKDKKGKDACGECDGICLGGNIGLDVPKICNGGSGSKSLSRCDSLKMLMDKKYVHIVSLPFQKSLAFETFGNNSEVYLDPSRTSPQKWNFVVVDEKKCHIMLRSYSSDPHKIPYYYLFARSDGTIGVSLFGGSLDQVWEVIEVDTGRNKLYLLKSVHYCTFLSGSNSGHMKDGAGLTFLMDAGCEGGKPGIGLAEFWHITQ